MMDKNQIKQFFRPTVMKVTTTFLYFAIVNWLIYAYVNYEIKGTGILFQLFVLFLFFIAWVVVPYILSCTTFYLLAKIRNKQ